MSGGGLSGDSTTVPLLGPEADLPAALQRPQKLICSLQTRLSSSGVRQWLATRRQALKPWLQFANVTQFQRPDTLPQWSRRMVKNLAHFQTNYAALSLLLLFYCLLTAPLLLATLSALTCCCRLLRQRQQERKLLLAGCAVPLTQQYASVALLSVPLLLLAGATAVIVWVTGASCIVVLLHASFFRAEALAGAEEKVELLEVTTECR